MNRFFNKKILAFTLAEMMVVLALFSVISAATMPVITARQKMEGTASTSGGIEGDVDDPWTLFESFKGLAYYNATQPDTAAVMVGDEVTDSSSILGRPSLIVVDKYGTGTSGSDDASQIGLFKDVSGVPYYGGRIMMSNSDQSTGSIAIGANALSYHSNTTSRKYNIAIGSNALSDNGSNTSKTSNVGIGASTLFGCESAYSVAIGNQAGYKTTSKSSVAIGNHATYSSSGTGSMQYSVAIGDGALMSPDTSVSTKYTTAIGTYAGGGGISEKGTFIGYYAGVNRDDKNAIVGIGTRAMSDITGGGEYGIGIGYYSGFAGMGNSISIGAYAGAWAENDGGTPMSSVYIGLGAGYHQGESENAVMIGYNAGNAEELTTMDDYSKGPVFIGYEAGHRRMDMSNGDINDVPAVLVGHGAGSGIDAGGGTYSIYMGNHSGYLTQAYDAVCLGPYACSDYQNGSSTSGFVGIAGKNGSWGDMLYLATNEKRSVIGDLPDTLRTSYLNTGNDLMLISPLYGNQTATTDILSSIILFGNVFSSKSSLTVFSDKRLKENIRLAKYGLNEIRKINVYNYNWKEGDTKTPQIGVIAQEVQKIIPESVHVDKENKFGGYLTVDGVWFLFPMVNAIKDLDKQVQTIQKKLVAYTKEYVSLVQRVNKLEKEVKVLEKENKTLTREVKVAYTKVKKAEKR